MGKPVAAVGANLVQIIGLVIVIFSLLNLPSAGAIVGLILGGILMAAATFKYSKHTED